MKVENGKWKNGNKKEYERRYLHEGIGNADPKAKLYYESKNAEESEPECIKQLQEESVELQNEIFEKVFGMAKIAQMSKEEVNIYLKSLSDMNVVRNQFRKMDNTIAALQSSNNALQSSNNALQSENAAQAKEIAELKQRFGIS